MDAITQKLLNTVGAFTPPVVISTSYVDDVFNTCTYTGNSGSSLVINNGIDLAGNGGMVWLKRRSGSGNNALSDSVRGANHVMYSDATGGDTTGNAAITAFNANGFSLGTSSYYNDSAYTQVAYTFRKASKFFDVVSWTGDGDANRTVPHSLGGIPGMIIGKRMSDSNWAVNHRNAGVNATRGLSLNKNVLAAEAVAANSVMGTSSNFKPGDLIDSDSVTMNAVGVQYIAYLFAHDAAADGIIQCGGFTTNAALGATVTLGWEPQFLMVKRVDGNQEWMIVDTLRGMPTTGPNLNDAKIIRPNTSDAETIGNVAEPTATGFNVYGLFRSTPYIYLAIRRSNKPPTIGTQVFNALLHTGTNAAHEITGVGFSPDMLMFKPKIASIGSMYSKLRGSRYSSSLASTNAEQFSNPTNDLVEFGKDGVSVGPVLRTNINYSAIVSILYFFKRAIGFFDVVNYRGNGGTPRAIPHNLGVAPELIILQRRDAVADKIVYYPEGTLYNLLFNSPTARASGNNYWPSAPTASNFYVGNAAVENAYPGYYEAYLFATKAGISKVGIYTGNGSIKTIDCGFTTGARFIMIKRIQSATEWFVWDTVRGIVVDNDPYLALSSTAGEVTTNSSISPEITGFTVNAAFPVSINDNGIAYLFLAIA